MRLLNFIGLIFLVLFFISTETATAAAEIKPQQTSKKITRKYIVDQLPMVFRTGPSPNYRMQKGLKTGDAVQILTIDEENGTTQIQTSNGKTGWVKTQYIVNREGAKSKLLRVQKQLSHLKKKSANNSQLQQRLKQQLTQTSERNQQLQRQVSELENNLQIEQQKSLRLSDKKRYDLVYAGGGIALISLIIGWILARRKPKGGRWR